MSESSEHIGHMMIGVICYTLPAFAGTEEGASQASLHQRGGGTIAREQACAQRFSGMNFHGGEAEILGVISSVYMAAALNDWVLGSRHTSNLFSSVHQAITVNDFSIGAVTLQPKGTTF